MKRDFFPYRSIGKEKNASFTTDLYTFKCLFKHQYIIEVELHPQDIYIVKFFQKNHRDSDNRYSLLNHEGIQKNIKKARNFLLILNTILELVLEKYNINNKSSFGFLGAPTLKESDKKLNKKHINIDGTVQMTKRYNTYGVYVKRYFDPEIFEHIEIDSSSCYLIKSRLNEDLKKEEVELFFANYTDIVC